MSEGDEKSAGLAERPISRRTFIMGAGAVTAGLAFPSLSLAQGKRSSPTAQQIRQLRAATKGAVLTRGSNGFNVASQPYDTRFDGIRPRVVLVARDAGDVQAAVRWAARNNVAITTRSGGHSYAGYCTVQNGLIVNVRNLKSVSPNPRSRTARIGSGTQLIDFYAGLARRGLTVPGGSCPSVGIAGLTMGGGIGLAARRWGTTSDNVISAQIVTADGRLRNVNAKSDEPLYWAIKGGGGGNFGIVTSFRFTAYPVRSASWFIAEFPWSEAADVVNRWQRWGPNATKLLDTICTLGTGIGTPTCSVIGQYFGSAAALRRVLSGLTSVVEPSSLNVGTSSYVDLMKRWAGCAELSLAECHLKGASPGGTLPRDTFSGKSDYVAKPMSRRGINTMISWIDRRQRQSTGSGALVMDCYGGALNEPKPEATAFVHRDNLFSIQYLSYWGAPGNASQSISWIRGVHRAMRPYVSGFAYQNYIDADLKNWQRAYYGENFARLRDVKRQYDPDDLFRFAQSIPV
jgi:FAD/FMN-containing dehydrogenase